MGSKEKRIIDVMLFESRRRLQRGNDDNENYFQKSTKELRIFKGNPNVTWSESYQKNVVKLAVMVLLYTYSEDDGKISGKEYRKIKGFFKTYNMYLTQKDYHEIEKLFKTRLTQLEFLEYLEQHDYEESTLLDAISVVHDMIRKSGKYLLAIDELKQAYKNR